MTEEIKEILFDKDTVETKIKTIGQQISNDYEGKELIVVCVLKGAVVFLSELMKNISIPFTLDFIQIGSYGKGKSPGVIEFKKDLETNVSGKHVLIIEDIVDSGKTIDFIIKQLTKRKSESIKICTLLDKASRREVKVLLDYVCFDVPNRFIVGYGIDYNEKYRNLPYIAAVD